jgi:hypothetical protein
VPRANWHLEDVTVDQSDPFAAPLAQRIDLSDPAVLRAKLTALMQLEGKLEDRGITCAIRNRPDSCCSACPLRGTSRVQRISALCRVGVEQERTLMAIIVEDA